MPFAWHIPPRCRPSAWRLEARDGTGASAGLKRRRCQMSQPKLVNHRWTIGKPIVVYYVHLFSHAFCCGWFVYGNWFTDQLAILKVTSVAGNGLIFLEAIPIVVHVFITTSIYWLLGLGRIMKDMKNDNKNQMACIFPFDSWKVLWVYRDRHGHPWRFLRSASRPGQKHGTSLHGLKFELADM